MGDRPTSDPIWGEGFGLLALGKAEPNLAAHGAVRGAIRDSFFAVLDATSEEDIVAILEELNNTSATLVAETE